MLKTPRLLSVLIVVFCFVGLSKAQKTIDEHTEVMPDGTWRVSVESVIPMEFMGVVQAFSAFDTTQQFKDKLVRDENGFLIGRLERAEEAVEGRRGHPAVNPNALPQGQDPALQTAPPTHGFERAVDISVNGMGYTSVVPADPCLDVGPNHVIQMINGGSGGYFRIYNKSLVSIGAQTYLDTYTGSVGGAGDPIVLYDALADRWVMTEFSASGNKLLVAVSQTASPTGAWYAYSYQATNFPDYPKYAIWNDCYVVTSNENSPAIYALPRANMLAGTAGSVVRFTVTSFGSIGFQAATPVTFDGGTAPPAGSAAMFMRMEDDLWSGGSSVDRLEIWKINYNAATPASSSITGPTYLNTAAFDSDLCGYTTLNCIDQPGTQKMDPIREVLMNRIVYRNIAGYEALVCSHTVDAGPGNADRAGVRWYELHRTGGSGGAWSIYQQGTYSPDANDRWMSSIAINENGDIGLAYNIAGTTGGNVYPSVRYTGRYKNDPLGLMTMAETTIIAGTASHGSNRYGDYNSLDVDPADGLSFYGTAMYNAASSWSTRIFKFSFPVVGCTSPTVSTNVTDNCGGGTFSISCTIGANGDSPNYDVYTSVNGAAQTFHSTRTPSTFSVGSYPFGTSVVIQVRHNANSACNQTLAAITSAGTSCCTAPSASVFGVCTGSNYAMYVTLGSMGSATSINIQIDPDAGGPSVPVNMQTVTTAGTYGPFGSYASASAINVILVHNLFAQCSLTFSNFTKTCGVPGAGCGLFTNGSVTAIADNATTTSTIVVPSQSGATITDLNVYVNISHTYCADLRLSLKSPANTTVNLISSGLCTSNDNIIAEFDDAGANGAVGTTCPINNLYVIPAAALAGFNGQLFEGTWTLTVQDVAAQDVGTLNTWCLIPTLLSPTVNVSPKVFLEGPYVSGLMSDTLRFSGLLPLTEPYTALGYPHAGGGGGETTTSGVLAVTGSNAIVDWVVVELRNSANSSQVLASRCALLQRDGDIVAMDGTSPVNFNNTAGSYFIAVRHRNHLGCMSSAALPLTNSTSTVNFSATATPVYGTAARKDIGGGVSVLWAGDVSFNHTLLYVGAGNDRDPILARIGGSIPTNSVTGYYQEDVNLNSQVKYVGASNDRDPILANIGGTIPTANKVEQIP
ncbi:MAG: proprotein convertase P-domain-containing protein [Flavobacteriales bacterium]|nr:proprotein convertase P-domain-containing protein [Flavobacteriales bacterium]